MMGAADLLLAEVDLTNMNALNDMTQNLKKHGMTTIKENFNKEVSRCGINGEFSGDSTIKFQSEGQR